MESHINQLKRSQTSYRSKNQSIEKGKHKITKILKDSIDNSFSPSSGITPK
jgi:NADPH-dependent 7-cyano-7-deazaguanine reductase QueF